MGSQLGGSSRIILRSLDSLEINAFVLGLGYLRPSGRLLTALVEASAGNPLHVQTIMDRLERTGRLRQGDGVTDFVGRDLPIDIDGSLLGAIELRLKLLPEEDRELLGLVALLDPPVSPEMVAAVADLPWDTVVSRLESARSERLIDVDQSLIAFHHPLLRTVLTRLLTAPRRSELELRIATELLQLDDDVSVISSARHLSRAELLAPPDLIADTCARGARLAYEKGDYASAATLAEAALSAASRLEIQRPDGLGQLHHLAASSHFRNHDRAAWRHHADCARAAAQKADDVELFCSVELLAIRAQMTFGPHPVDDRPLTSLLERLGHGHEVLQGRIHEELSEICFGAGRYGEGEEHGRTALAVAGKTGDPGDEAMAHFAIGLNTWAFLRLHDARASFETCERLSVLAADRWLTTWGPGRLSLVSQMEGRFDEVLRLTAANGARAEVLGDWSELALASALSVAAHAARGEVELADKEGERGFALTARGDYVWAPTILLPALAGMRAERGDATGAAEALQFYERVGRPAPRPFRQLVAVALDDLSAIRSEFVPRRLSAEVNALTLVGFCAYAAAAVRVDERQAVEWAIEDLLPVAERGVVMPVGWNVLVPRLVGAAFRCSDHFDASKHWLDRAVERATLSGAGPELGRCWVELAMLHASDHPDADRDEARRCVARAVSIARRYGLVPLERAATELGLSLGRFAGDAAIIEEEVEVVRQPLVGAILFTDIVDSTSKVRAARDAEWIRVLGEHDRRLRACLARFAGTEFAYTGDGLAAYFSSALSAVQCAEAFHEALGSMLSTDGMGLPIRIGVCWGEATPRGHDLAGSTISRTVRVMGLGGAGQTVVDSAIRDATMHRFGWMSLGAPALKGFEDERHELYLLTRNGV
jgi:class 3 adenylate cyclase